MSIVGEALIELAGFVDKDPIIKTKNDKKFAIFSIRTSRKIGKENTEWETKWYNVNIFNNDYLTEYVEKNVKKGSFVIAKGLLVQNLYKNNDGEEVLGINCQIFGTRGSIKVINKSDFKSEDGSSEENTNKENSENNEFDGENPFA